MCSRPKVKEVGWLMAGSAEADDELLGPRVQKGKVRHARPKQRNYGRRNHSRRPWGLGTSAIFLRDRPLMPPK